MLFPDSFPSVMSTPGLHCLFLRLYPRLPACPGDLHSTPSYLHPPGLAPGSSPPPPQGCAVPTVLQWLGLGLVARSAQEGGGQCPPGGSLLQVALPGMRWVDGHKGVFSVELTAVSSVHPQVGGGGNPGVRPWG